MINKWISILLVSASVQTCLAQNCDEQLNTAQRAYYDGNLNLVISSIERCVSNKQFNREDQEAALKLLVNSYLILNEDSLADSAMANLLNQFPLTRVRSTDLVEFKRLHGSYDIRPKINFGIQVGFNSPDFEVMQYRSYASFREEPSDYRTTIAPSVGVSGDYAIWKNLFVSVGLIYQNHQLSFNEILLDLQELRVRESIHSLHTPLLLKYVVNFEPVSFFAAAGVSGSFILSSKADLTLFELDREFPPPIFGNSGQEEDYTLTFQRRALNFNYALGAGIQKQFGFYALEAGIYYDYGLNNLVKTSERYSEEFLLQKFSYVPDDFKMNHYRFTVGIYRKIFKSEKR